MKRHLLLLIATILLPAGLGALPAARAAEDASAAESRPNIVILVADDLGYADVGFHGSDIRTPNIDRLAAEGVRLERFYVSPVCSPTRAGLMTGRWPIRFGLQNAVIPPWRDRGLPPDEVTIAEMLAEAGYNHRACIGKWHLGHARRNFLPLAQGFNHFYGHYNGAIDYFSHERDGEMDWHRNGETVHESGYSTDLLGAEAARFIAGVPPGEPYLLYVPFNAPHTPLQAKQADEARYPHRQKRRRTYAAMVEAMDRAIGRVLAAIDRRGDAEDTFVLFFSDNGGTPLADNGKLRGHKATVFEGGIRAAAAVRWPAGGLDGGRECVARIGYIDVLPMLRGIVGLNGEPELPLDGIDVLRPMRDGGSLPDRPWFNYFWQDRDRLPQWSVQTDEWKLVFIGEPTAAGRFTMNEKTMLFHMAEDPHEKRNLIEDHPRVAAELLDQLAEFQQLAGGEPLPPYGQGAKGFQPPRDWQVRQ